MTDKCTNPPCPSCDRRRCPGAKGGDCDVSDVSIEIECDTCGTLCFEDSHGQIIPVEPPALPPIRWTDTSKRLRGWARSEGVTLSDRSERKLTQLVLRTQREARRG